MCYLLNNNLHINCEIILHKYKKIIPMPGLEIGSLAFGSAALCYSIKACAH